MHKKWIGRLIDYISNNKIFTLYIPNRINKIKIIIKSDKINVNIRVINLYEETIFESIWNTKKIEYYKITYNKTKINKLRTIIPLLRKVCTLV